MNGSPAVAGSLTFEDALRTASSIRYQGISQPVARLLYALAQQVLPGHAIVEIGSCLGYSTVFLGCGSRSGGGAAVHCLDAWGLPASSTYSDEAYAKGLEITEGTFREFRSTIERAGLSDLVIPHRAYSHRYSRQWPRELAIGLLYIDGDHSEWGAYADWFLYRPHLADGAHVVFHDYGARAVERAVRRIEPEAIREPRIVGTGYGGREALVFRYQGRGDTPPWPARAAHWELSLRNWLEQSLPIEWLRRGARLLRQALGALGWKR